ncbi:efflux RND transporter periplasmic adaptor subunit [Sphingomonas sp.]|uniref:efflux RND transporter periplasmic adaptor subunit n=1 Tax=Sphingomonas sp. TaxID=28214 RepID=UPI002FC7729F
MSVVRIQAQDEAAGGASGSAMDRVVAPSRAPARIRIIFGLLLAALAAAAFMLFAPTTGSQTIAADRVTISTVVRGQFEDFLPLRARVTPLVSVFLDAVEGGRVEKVLVEDGSMVEKGQLLAVLSNSDLQLNLLARQTEVTQQINSMRSQELALAQTRLQNERLLIDADLATRKAQRQFELQRPLADKGFVPAKVFRDSQDDYQMSRQRSAVLRRAQATDERLQTSQLAQLRDAAASLSTSLDIARATLDALNLRAPVAGQLTAFSIQVGQSMNRGERLGQIDSAGRNKLVADVDEFHLGRVRPGQRATAAWGGKTYQLKVAKIYPQVRNGTFEVDFQFVGAEPDAVQRGQTLQLRLTLGDTVPALLIPSGAFANDTGGTWLFVVSPDGSTAVRREVRLGRRNANHIEVLAGLEPGERVLTSPYTGFADKVRLDLER